MDTIIMSLVSDTIYIHFFRFTHLDLLTAVRYYSAELVPDLEEEEEEDMKIMSITISLKTVMDMTVTSLVFDSTCSSGAAMHSNTFFKFQAHFFVN